MSLEKIVSGGQTGVDRAALDAAREAGLALGGWCPRCRRSEDRRVPDRYPLRETPSPDYAQRTRWNVRDSDATLILARDGCDSSGTVLAGEYVRILKRPCLVADLLDENAPAQAAEWLRGAGVKILNVAGPRESEAPGIGAQAERFLARTFAALEKS